MMKRPPAVPHFADSIDMLAVIRDKRRSGMTMRRRDIITLLGAAPLVSLASSVCSAQQAVPVVGFLYAGPPDPDGERVVAFRKGLSGAGYDEGRNVAIEFRWAERDEQLPELASDLIRRGVALIVTPVSTQAALSAKAAAAATTPIVFAVGGDPVALGLVASLNQPGGNITGISILNVELVPKRLGLLREMAPNARHFNALVNPDTAFTPAVVRSLTAGAKGLGLQVDVSRASSDAEIEANFVSISQRPGGALLVGPDAFFTSRSALITSLAARHAIPAMYVIREFATAGGLMSYGPDIVNVCEQVGAYAGRILAGEKPADLPVAQSAKFHMVINLKAAKALGLAVPPTLLATADEVIE
jgi:putative ABC transport system substrate-binding protein